jgi:3-hydroxyisobutyrate dehydrogenase-like beta-hydroxyacid dehydrogenase
MLADDDAVTAAHTGPDGSCTTARPGTVLVDMSTVAPGTSRALAAAARARGLAFLDAPVSGSTAAAAAGTLTIMAAGDAVAVATAEPVFRALGSHLVHLGDTGAGTAMKLVVNTVVHALNNAVSEALVLAERAGIERAVAYDVFRHSAIAAPFVQYRQAAFERPEETPVASRLELAVKDLRLALELAERTGTDLPQAGANIAIMRDAVRAGYGDHDESGVAEHLRASAAARDTAPDAPRETARETARDAARPPER